jgi:hypothetical protein
VAKPARSRICISHQELRSREEELLRAAQEQRFQEEQLRRREQELAEREMDIVERELHLLMCQLSQEKPRVRKRKGNFKRSRLLKLREGGSHISLPSGTPTPRILGRGLPAHACVCVVCYILPPLIAFLISEHIAYKKLPQKREPIRTSNRGGEHDQSQLHACVEISH